MGFELTYDTGDEPRSLNQYPFFEPFTLLYFLSPLGISETHVISASIELLYESFPILLSLFFSRVIQRSHDIRTAYGMIRIGVPSW